MDDDKRKTWDFILRVLISILTAIVTALGTASCVRAVCDNNPQLADTLQTFFNPEGNPD